MISPNATQVTTVTTTVSCLLMVVSRRLFAERHFTLAASGVVDVLPRPLFHIYFINYFSSFVYLFQHILIVYIGESPAFILESRYNTEMFHSIGTLEKQCKLRTRLQNCDSCGKKNTQNTVSVVPCGPNFSSESQMAQHTDVHLVDSQRFRYDWGE